MADAVLSERMTVPGVREREIYESTVHGLRMRGWSRLDAESEALDRQERRRALTNTKDMERGCDQCGKREGHHPACILNTARRA